MPILLHTPAENIDKHGPSRLQQLAGPMSAKVQDTAQHYSSLAVGQTKMLGTCHRDVFPAAAEAAAATTAAAARAAAEAAAR